MISKERPDLATKPFQQLLNTYISDTIHDHVERDDHELPRLVEQALAYDAQHTLGYYYAQYFFYMHKHTKLLLENMDEGLDSCHLLLDKIQLQKLICQLTDMLNKGRNLNNRQN
ncbi:hypothetical protein [Spirosoma harenae]